VNVLVGTDVEGVAGIASLADQSRADGRYYEQTRRLATAEVNAAVSGLLAAGAEDVLVVDGHGPGGLSFEDIHPEARLLHGRPPAPRQVRDPFVAACDVCVMIGQHAMAGVARSNQNHTQNSRSIDYYKLNGRPIGEIAQFALYNGALGLPLIFLSGEEAACREAEELIPEIVTAAVKVGLGRSSAISLAAPKARALIEEKIQEAVASYRAAPWPPLVWEGPFELEKRFFFTDEADIAVQQPGAERVDDQTVRFRGDDIREIAYR
tara:strand:- start:2690 stop:3484 length:795 start_codon:yes stop_codon:yes gene_type:complete